MEAETYSYSFSRVLLMVFSLSFKHHGKSYDLSGTNFFLQRHTSIHVHGYIASFPALREREEKELSDSSLRLGNKANSTETMFWISYLCTASVSVWFT